MMMKRRTTTTCQRSPVPPGCAPEGLTEAVLDPATLALVEQAIPPQLGGRALLLHLLGYATRSPETTLRPYLVQATGESMDEVMVRITSIKDVARSAGSRWAPETYQKILLVLEALGVIRRRFHRQYTEIRIFIGRRIIHLPACIAELSRLQATYRSAKVRRFAQRVARRLILSEFEARMTSTAADVSPSAVQQILVELLHQHGVSAIDQHLVEHACLRLDGRVPAREGVLQTGASISHQTIHAFVSEFVTAQPETDVQRVPSTTPQHDDSPVARTPDAGIGCAYGPVATTPAGECARWSDMHSPESPLQKRSVVEYGDSLPDVSIITLSLEKEIPRREETLIDATTPTPQRASSSAALSPVVDDSSDALRQEAQMYESLFDRGCSRQWRGSLMKMLKETTKDARRLAAIGAMYYSVFPQPDGTMLYSPGGWFTAACRRYCRPGAAIPAEVRVWAETTLPLQDIQRLLNAGCRLPAEGMRAWRNDGQDADEQADVSVAQDGCAPEATTLLAQHAALSVPPATPGSTHPRTWMDRAQAELLRARILRDGAAYALQAVVQSGERSQYTILVTWPDDGTRVDILHEAEWETYWTAVQEVLHVPARQALVLASPATR